MVSKKKSINEVKSALFTLQISFQRDFLDIRRQDNTLLLLRCKMNSLRNLIFDFNLFTKQYDIKTQQSHESDTVLYHGDLNDILK